MIAAARCSEPGVNASSADISTVYSASGHSTAPSVNVAMWPLLVSWTTTSTRGSAAAS
jgi:hypothetical protein